MNRRLNSLLAMLTAGAMAIVLAACSGSGAQSSVTPSGNQQASGIPNAPGQSTRSAEPEYIEICKDYSGTPGPAVAFSIVGDIDNDGDTPEVSYSVNLSNGQCIDVWQRGQFVGDSIQDRVVITETVPAGYTASYVITRRASNGTITVAPSVSGNSANVTIDATAGLLIVFTNTQTTTPPPPPGVGGCTPGYWKQSQHFDSWTAPYTPNTLFSTVFENAFPGMTLLQVLEQGGGGLNALGRHTVAALLNAASSGVSYGMTTAQVIAAFNAAYPSGDISGLHLQFETANERGCPLN